MEKKNNVIKIIKCICFVLVLSSVLSLVYGTVKWKDTQGDYISVKEQLKNTDKNTIEAVFVGSSHVYRGVYPAVLWNDYGIAAFDLSVSEQDKDCSYNLLKELLRNQSPKVVCVEMYGTMFDEHDALGNLYRNIYAVDSPKAKYDMIKDQLGEDNAIDYLIGWPVFHTRYKELKEYDFYDNPQNSYLRGAVVEDGIEMGQINPVSTHLEESVPISESNKAWIDSLYELSREENFDLIFFMTPYRQDEDERRIENGVKEYAKTLGIEYVDFSLLLKELDFKPQTDMGDIWHCNIQGATKVSNYLGEMLSSRYDFSNKKDASHYRQWDDDYTNYIQMVQYRELKKMSGKGEIIPYIVNAQNLYTILSLEGDYENLIPYLELLGIPKEEYSKGGKWIIKGKNMWKVMDNNPGESHFIRKDRFDTFTIQCNDDGNFLANVLFNNEGVNYYGNGMNIIVYDEFRHELLGNFGLEN